MAVLFCAWERFFIDVAADLLDSGVDLRFVETGMTRYAEEKMKHRGVTVLDSRDFRFSSRICQLNSNRKECLSAETVHALRACESEFITITDRLCFFPLSVRARKKIYYELLLYWTCFLQENRIKVVILNSVPHRGYDTVLYHVARYLNLRVLFFESAKLLGNYMFLKTSCEALPPVTAEFLQMHDREQLRALCGETLLREVYEDSSLLSYSKQIVSDALSSNRSFLHKIRKVVQGKKLRLAPSSVMRGLCDFSGYVKALARKRAVHTVDYHGGEKLLLVLKMLSLINMPLKKKLYAFYEKYAVSLDKSRKYVFFAMNYQPEATTAPLGDIFDEQYLALSVLSKSVPDDWQILVKEHPAQFFYSFWRNDDNAVKRSLDGRFHRTIEDYQRIIALPNVHLVSPEEDTELLIRHSMFTATITGSVGWQSIRAYKPVIVFGSPWYCSCQSCFSVTSVESCRHAIQEILGKSADDVHMDLLRFLACYKKNYLFQSYYHYGFAGSDEDYNHLVKQVAQAVVRELMK